ncbi:preprotein translocase subunit SecY [Candidatus Pacearchaeota archaeon]|nr:preprotein translocase subunit SecY [Candidatus Pacearchaeota archaeon]
MAFNLKPLLYNLPEVTKPTEKKVDFNTKLKWTIIILAAFFILVNVPLYGLKSNSLAQFEYLQVILGTDFGSIISLGIGPIVMASIILQLLVGAGILNINTNTPDGRKYFQGLQKLGVLVFIVFEALVYVLMGGFQPATPSLAGIVIFQLMIGGLAIMFMDEVSSKWGFGSGVSLFILAGVARVLFTGLFQFIGPTGENCLMSFSDTPCAGKLLVFIQALITGAPREAVLALAAIAVTILIFLAVIWAQSLKIEIPLSYDRLRGYNVKWPLSFFYASNMPVILTAALLANIQLFGGLLEKKLGAATWLGSFSNGQATSGLAYWLGHSNVVEALINNTQSTTMFIQMGTHILFFVLCSAVFSVFWVKTAGMDETSQAKKIIASGLQIPGFRKDERVLESILKRYIMPLTVMGGIAIGLLAAITDSLGALTSGTSILLAITISYQFYQNIAQQHAVDMHPAMKKMMGN